MAKFLFISDKKIMVTLHAIAWIIIIIIPLYLNSAFGGGNNHRMYEFYLHTLSAGVIFYVGYLWLVPRFFLQKRQLTYLLILIGLIIATHLITNFIEERFLFDPIRDEQFREALKNIRRKDENFRPPMKAFGFFNHFLSSVLLSGFAIGLGVMEKLKENEKKQKELEKEKLNSELAFLKNQVSPHFFFNTLNNIYSLIELNTTDAQEAVMKLSRLMRYLLYESEHGETQLSHEINFMNHYIDLMRLRISPKVGLSIEMPEKDNNLKIPPLLFIPFIENAFKHGISYRERSFIKIKMDIQENKILFTCNNSLTQATINGLEEKHSGIGLDNVKKRLELLFPEKHNLKISKTESEFSVILEIDLKRE